MADECCAYEGSEQPQRALEASGVSVHRSMDSESIDLWLWTVCANGHVRDFRVWVEGKVRSHMSVRINNLSIGPNIAALNHP